MNLVVAFPAHSDEVLGPVVAALRPGHNVVRVMAARRPAQMTCLPCQPVVQDSPLCRRGNMAFTRLRVQATRGSALTPRRTTLSCAAAS